MRHGHLVVSWLNETMGLYTEAQTLGSWPQLQTLSWNITGT